MQKTLHASAGLIKAGVHIFLFLLFSMFFSTQSVYAYEISSNGLSVDDIINGENYSAVLYNNSNGLPTSEANAIVESDEGFIWIGSYSGLIRYDGNNFERMDSRMGIANVFCLYVDSANRLWVGTNDSGLYMLDEGDLRKYGKEDGLSSLSIRSITEDNDGNIYITTTDGMAYIDKGFSLHRIDDLKIQNEYVREIWIDSNNLVYGVTRSGAVFTMKNKKVVSYFADGELGISDIHTLLPDPYNPGYIYIGTSQSEIYYGKLEKIFKLRHKIRIKPLSYVNSFKYTDDGLWVCTDQGIGIVRDRKFYPLLDLPFDSSVEGMMIDYLGNPWFASSKQGVMKIVRNRFTNVFDKYKIREDVINTTCEHDGKLFIGTKTNGLIVIDDEKRLGSIPIKTARTASGEKLNDTDLIETLSECKIRSCINDSRGRMWISTFSEHGLIRYEEGNIVKFTTDDGMPSDRIRAVCERSDGSFAVCCGNGLAIIKDDRVVKVYDEKNGIKNTEILTAAEMENGDLILGTDGGGIYIISGDKVTNFDIEDGLGSDVIMRLKKSRYGNFVWFVASNSIGYIDSDHKIVTIESFPYTNNFDIYENSKGEAWIMSSNGIYVASIEDLKTDNDIEPFFYGMDNGLPCITSANSYSELTEEGDLYIAGSNGVAKVNINKDYEQLGELKIAVPYAEGDDKLIYPDDTGEFLIPSDVKKLTFYAYVYNYSLANPDIDYKLEGFDEKSMTVKRSKFKPLVYTNLKGGDYRLAIKIKDSQKNDEKELDISVIKQKTFLEYWWAPILIIIIAAAVMSILISLYIDYKTRKYIEKENEQKQLVREIVEAFAKIIDMKDRYTNGHSSRVAEYTSKLTKELGYDDDTVEKYYNIALLHDIGKIGIPEEVLNKKQGLTDEEYKLVKKHAEMGYDALKNISIMPELAVGAGCHHERPDGKGYPKGLKGEDIPRVAQIIAVADAFDAMYSDRPYRKCMRYEDVIERIKEARGSQLTEDVVDAFLRLAEEGKLEE